MNNTDLKTIFEEIGGDSKKYFPEIKENNANYYIIQINYIGNFIELSNDFLTTYINTIKHRFSDISNIEVIYGNYAYRCNKYTMLD